MNTINRILHFPITTPFEVFYRNDRIASPVGPHSHDGAELYYTLTALPDVLLNNKVFAVPAGTLIIIPPFCVHQLYHESGKIYERYVLSISIPWLDAVFFDSFTHLSYLKDTTHPLILTPDSTYKEQLNESLDFLSTFSKHNTPEAMCAFFALLSKLDQMVHKLSPQSPQLFTISSGQKNTNQIIDYIHEHIYENLNVSNLASHFYLHPDYLSRLFKKHAHLSISQYITLQKIATAQSLLRQGYTVTQVQDKLGYSSYAYFFKVFQKNTGISPSRYREQYLGQ